MKLAFCAVVALATNALAFPHMLKDFGADNLAQFEAKVKRAAAAGPVYQPRRQAKRQSGGSIPISIPLPPLPIVGLPIPTSIDIPYVSSVGIKVIPDAAHPFQPSQSSDQRGGCPGLNIMSNYGYMSRTGVVGAGELIYAMMEMLGYSQDLAQVLIALALRSGAMDPTTFKMSIGTRDSRTDGPNSGIVGPVPGLFDYALHNQYEIDGSMAYDDEYFHRNSPNAGSFFNGTRFARMQATADANGGLYDANFQSQHRFDAYNECVATNPTCTWNVVGEILFYGADCYTYLGMASSNEDTSQIRPPDSASIQSFFGAQKQSDGTFKHVDEKLKPGPDGNWYRRSTPLTTAEIGGDGVISYLAHPVVFGANNGKAPNTFTPSAQQLSGTGPGAFCIVLSAIAENDGALGARFGKFAPNIAAVARSLVGPAGKSLNCGGLDSS